MSCTVRRPAMAAVLSLPCRIVASRAVRPLVCRAPSRWCRGSLVGCLRFVTGGLTRRWRKMMTMRTRLPRRVKDRRPKRLYQPIPRRLTRPCVRIRLPMHAGRGLPRCPHHPAPRWSFTQAHSRRLPNGHLRSVYRFPHHRFRLHATRQAADMHLYTSAPEPRRAKHTHRFARRFLPRTP